jgi:hypothetical protein
MSVAYGEIARVLGGARKRQVRIVLLGAAGFGVAAAVLCLLAGAAGLALKGPPWVRAASLAGAVTALFGAAALAVRALLRTAWTDEAAARTVAAGEPALRSDLVSSVELSRERADIQATGRFSLALVDAHLAGTAERVRTVDLSRVLPDRFARLGGLALLAAVVANVVALVAGGETLARGYGRLLARGAAAAAPAIDPITGDIELTYRYPAYMKREPRTVSGTGGEIRAPKGTEVELRTRADRKVETAEIVVDLSVDPLSPTAQGGSSLSPTGGEGQGEGARSRRPESRRLALEVRGDRDLSGRLHVEEGGSYRFRFLDRRGRAVAEGPPIPVAVEPDAYPEVRITAPERELEVDAGAVVQVEWQAEDDVGLSEVALVVKPPAGGERRQVLRAGAEVRRDGGTVELDLKPERLGEGEALSYWIEAADGDRVSGPKKSVSETHRVKVYSEAEHRRRALEKARQVFEELVTLLADRLETFAAGSVATQDRLALAEQLDVRTRHLHERMRETAREIRKDRAGPREIATAFDNVAGQLRFAEQRLVAVRTMVGQAFRIRSRPDPSLVRSMAGYDAQLDQELEKSALYLEQLLDKSRAEDLVRLAKDLASKRRDLADLLEKYKAAPSDAARQELVARIQRMKERVKELLARMQEAAKGFNDEHMNQEALAELQKSQDLVSGLDAIEQLLAKGDVEGAMKALDQMAATMDQMLAGMQRTAGMPDEKAQALMKEMLAFKQQLDRVKGEQQKAADETAEIRKRYRDALAQRTKQAEEKVRRLQRLAREAREDVEAAQPGVTFRAEPEYDQSREALTDLERALGMKELQAAFETSLRAAPAVERLARFLEEDLALSEHNPAFTRRDPADVRDAQARAREAVPKAREIREELARLFPDPRSVLGEGDQRKMEGLAKRQAELEQKAGELQKRLAELMQQAPIFPPTASGQLGETRGHMGQAAAQLGNRNPQRGHGEQELALDALERFQKGLEDAARKGQGQSGGMGFPFPFADAGGGQEEGNGFDPSREKVKIPGAEAHKVPEEFRRDLLEAMKQGTPERYRPDVQRYYEELVR